MALNRFTINADLQLGGYADFKGRMPVKDQKLIFKRNIFGRKYVEVYLKTQGREGYIKGHFSTSFGQDKQHFKLTFDEIAYSGNHPEERITW